MRLWCGVAPEAVPLEPEGVLGAFRCLAGLLIGEPMLMSSIPPACSMACIFGSPTSMEPPWGRSHPRRLAPTNGLRWRRFRRTKYSAARHPLGY